MTAVKRTVQSTAILWQNLLKKSNPSPSSSRLRVHSTLASNPSCQILKSPPLISIDLPDIWPTDSASCDLPSIPECTKEDSARVIDGKSIAEEIKSGIASEVNRMKESIGKVPGLAVILVGQRKDSQAYVRNKIKACEEAGIKFVLTELPDKCTEHEVCDALSSFNEDISIHGVLVQLPLPQHMDEGKILDVVRLEKDVDGFHPLNMGNLAMRGREPLFIPCTPKGCVELLLRSDVDIMGKRAVVIGRSNIVGLPTALLLQRHHATVSIVHAFTKNQEQITREADIVVSAAGVPNLVRGSWLKPGAVVIDVGTYPVEDPSSEHGYRLIGDVCYEEAVRVASAITPVPVRKDLLVLLRSVGRVAPDVTLTYIRNSLASAVASSADRNVEEVEAALSLLYALGESLSDEAMRNGNGLLRELVPMLLSTRFPCHSNRLVALVYLDTITRYMKFVQENTQYIPLVLAAFLDERGIHHSNVNVSRRASYLFMRVVKLLKSKLVPFIETILQSLQDKVSRFTSIHCELKDLLGSEDGSHIFEAIGILIGMENVPLEKQSDYLSSLLTPLCQQVETLLVNAKVQNPVESPAKIANMQQIIMAINALSKGFSERLVTASRPAIGLMFKQTLDVLLQILVVFPKIEPLRCKVTSFIHRMVDTLGASVFPYLPKALEQLLAESEPKELVGFLTLLNQLICKFNVAVRDILEEVYPVISNRMFNIIPRDSLPSGPGSNTEEIRELQELERTLYTFLNVITTHNLSEVFLSPQSRAYLDPMMQLLLSSSCSHKDITVRKACVQIFIGLIKDWCARLIAEEKVPGFQSFIIEVFAMNCCLYSVLDKSFEFSDANTFVLFGEIVLALKVMYEKFGDDFIVRFVSKGFPTAHSPQELAKQYCKKLQGNDVKALKSFYQSLIENLRLEQNGSLVFR